MGDKNACKETLKAYLDRGCTDNTMKLSNLKKCMTECGLKGYTTTLESSIFMKHCDKAKKNASIDKIIDVVLPDLADYEAKNKKKDKDVILSEIMTKLSKKPEAKGVKVDATTARLTDASGYTGSHKERFNADGTGKGMDGRADRADTSGYVGNYKGAGTYDKKQ